MNSAERMASIVERLRADPSLAARLPGDEGKIARDALDGLSVYEIAQRRRISEQAVWDLLGIAAKLAAGRSPATEAVTGGLGSDTDPGVTGGFGETGFGSLGLEPPVPTPEEPEGDEETPPVE